MEKVQALRKEIDTIDNQILNLLAKRFELVKTIGKLKNIHGLTIVDKDREEEKMENLSKKAKTLKVDPKFIASLWKKIFSHSYTIEDT